MADAGAAFTAFGFGASPNELATAVAAAVMNCRAWKGQLGEASYAKDFITPMAAEEVGRGEGEGGGEFDLGILTQSAGSASDSTEFCTAQEGTDSDGLGSGPVKADKNMKEKRVKSTLQTE